MTNHSPITSNGYLLPNLTKGSTYGKQARCSSGHHSFQEPQRDGGSYNTHGTEVLYGQAPIFSLQSGSIIIACDKARDPSIA